MFEQSKFDRPLISWVSPVIIFKYWHNVRFFPTWKFPRFKIVTINIKCPWGSFASSFKTIGCKSITHADFKMSNFNKLQCNWLKLKGLHHRVTWLYHLAFPKFRHKVTEILLFMNSCQFCCHHTVTEQWYHQDSQYNWNPFTTFSFLDLLISGFLFNILLPLSILSKIQDSCYYDCSSFFFPIFTMICRFFPFYFDPYCSFLKSLQQQHSEICNLGI